MKKKLLFCALLVTVLVMAQDEKPFTIKGSMSNISMPVQKVYLSYRLGDKNVIDSVVPINNTYWFQGNINEAKLASMRIKYLPDVEGKQVKISSPRDFISVFLIIFNILIKSFVFSFIVNKQHSGMI